MRKTLGFLCAAALVLTWAAAARPGEKTDPQAIVAKAIDAMGGEAKLAKLQSATWKEKGTYYGMGDGQDYVGNYAVQYPGQFRMEIVGVFTSVLNGDKGWNNFGGKTKEMTEQELTVHRNNLHASWVATLVPLKHKAFTLAALAPTKVDDHPAVGVKVTHKGFPDVKLYFDNKTHLLVKSEWPTQAAEQKYKDVTATMSYSKYQEMGGVNMPTRMVMKYDDKRFVEADIQDMKPAGKQNDSVFAKP
jgi:hypothetical protein